MKFIGSTTIGKVVKLSLKRLQNLKNERNKKGIVSDLKNACRRSVWRVCTIGMLMASLSILFMGVAQALTNSGGGIEPVAQFHFEGNAEDSSGNGNNGTIIGATFVQGISGQALSFDGVNDYVKTNANINTLPLTIEAWVYPRSITGTGVNNKYIIDNDAGHNAHAIGIDDNRFMIVYHEGGLLSSVEHSTNTWYHVAGVWEQG